MPIPELPVNHPTNSVCTGRVKPSVGLGVLKMASLKMVDACVETEWLLDIVALRDTNMCCLACKLIVTVVQLYIKLYHSEHTILQLVMEFHIINTLKCGGVKGEEIAGCSQN